MILALFIYLLTLVFVLWQPRGLSIGWSALGGAALAIVLGVVEIEAIPAVWRVVWDPTLTLIALILISLVLDAAGFFRWCALHLAHGAGRDGRRLFLLLLLLSALLAAVFANDGAVLIMTPLTLAITHALKLERRAVLAFLLATGFVVDSTSLPFIISNLVNMVVAGYFHLGFTRYAAVMSAVNFAAFFASLAACYLVFRRELPAVVDLSVLEAPREAILDPLVFRLAFLVLPLMGAAYFLAQRWHWPVAAVTGSGAAVLLLAALHGHLRRARIKAAIPVWTLIREAPWAVVWFSLGMYLIVFGLRAQGVTRPLASVLEALSPLGVWAAVPAGFVFAALAAAMNNLPAVLFASLSIDQATLPAAAREAMIYANVVGGDLGPKMTPIGSLATLLWLHVLQGYGLRISWGSYARVGLVLTVPVLFVTLLVLAAWLAVVA
jgi:arsenical pump membrane protein